MPVTNPTLLDYSLQSVPFKTQPNNNHIFGTKIKQEAGKLLTSPLDTRVKVTLVARPLLTPVAPKLCSRKHGERLIILEHYFTSKSFAAVREAFSSAYPDKEVPNKTTTRRLVTKSRDTGSVCL
jgi:hypothetical protein